MIRTGLRNSSVSIRYLHSTRSSYSFIGDWFGSKKTTEKKDIVKEQDNLEEGTKIVILNEKNSPNKPKFTVKSHMPDFKIHQWKTKNVTAKRIESTYNTEDLVNIINDTLKSLQREPSELEKFEDVKLHDLTFRFQFTKQLQRNLGFDIKDSILTKSHDLKVLFDELNAIVNRRFLNERNANDIALKPEDFSAPNVYVNQELSEFEKAREFNKLVEQARNSL
ncbi:hypothetical protein PSN45_005061 [Yamadazyma tenuis]|uniref:Large ribosomal subunit protein mL50 n=1 Tax=Candida tenuis (strain ATCC 10573 / BCRC 21748 / CBS 615 / JCM 9827 / NBRC 10315 / NRRL Y-1498 / VKM Y-70) TaxID=590646 RepID=G3B2N2_CANTC|nr:uncharacterized protein CANTEDRAFT_113504 [Yamadazyma tenuis ATCC 10573]XP_006685912.1 uncharacterized protein CANTEDRAFT_113504 [Yamadazyma tenuis ATCC 10573]EGV65105.1 hypothetical protein CANTEDRAFT_113504 [Yamadazyma tenuis ATCC 10573]EGV65106.1 hypothetical protein CANTEDRAFT_113504 [Yamadazyma tenuis ATCC 10573]WEJ97508.1 hypothetical protein PSN45_005061 [Yamadazyma tenuis]